MVVAAVERRQRYPKWFSTFCQGERRCAPEQKPSLAIVGGGLGGMISCRVALSSEKYSKIRVFEKDPFFGGNWTPSEKRREMTRTVYEDLR